MESAEDVHQWQYVPVRFSTAQKMKFSIKDFFSKFGQIYRRNPYWKTSFFVQCSFPFNSLWFQGDKVDLHLGHNILYLHRAWNHFICELCVKFTKIWLAIHLMENLPFSQSSVGMWSSKSKFPCTQRFTLSKCSANNTLDVRSSKDLC